VFVFIFLPLQYRKNDNAFSHDAPDEEEVGTNHTVDSSPAAAFQSEARIRKFMKDIEETTSKGDGESNVPRIDKKIDKMQQDLGDFIDELESGNIYAGDEDEFATNEEIGGQFDEDLENEINETFFDTDKKEVEEEDPDAVIDDI
tara:strand:+ start:263 stop:697 length:435 start_codon:yes stop_codon:yes gene_type:complete